MEEVISIVRKVISLQGEHVCQNRAELVYNLKYGHGLLDGMDYLLYPVWNHDQFMNDLPNVTKSLNVKAHTVYFLLLQIKTEIVFY